MKEPTEPAPDEHLARDAVTRMARIPGGDMPVADIYDVAKAEGLVLGAIRAAVAAEREAILKLGESYGHDCCEEFKAAIRARWRP
jgi:hypothetical protein